MKNNNTYKLLSYIKRQPLLRNNIISSTSFLKNDSTMSERVYCLIHNIKTQAVCKGCGIDLKYVTRKQGYRTFCSLKCSNNDIDVRAKRTEALKPYEKRYYFNFTKSDLDSIKQELSFSDIHSTIFQVYNKIKDGKYINNIIKKDKKLVTGLVAYTSYLPKDCIFMERVYCLCNSIKTPPKCECGEDLKFYSIMKGFRTYCSPSCRSRSNIFKNKYYKTATQNNKIKFYPIEGNNEKLLLDIMEDLDNVIIDREFRVYPYYPDGYCHETNTIYDVFEKYHYKTEEQIQKDLERQKYIQEKLNCKFIIIKDETH